MVGGGGGLILFGILQEHVWMKCRGFAAPWTWVFFLKKLKGVHQARLLEGGSISLDESFDFGFLDNWGREVGGVIEMVQCAWL